ncbi:MAG: FtsX-like permease family protein [Syntrophorhabdus sp.]|nr:FtsX-like permease family protein [Syntrophorhabdus sp.]
MRVVTKSFLRYLIKRPGLSVLQLLGIACGVAAVIGMTVSARSALTSFAMAVDFLRGKSTHVMERPAGPLDEKTLEKLMLDPAVRYFSPVVDRKIKLKTGESVRVLGIDPFLDRSIRPELSNAPFSETDVKNRQTYVDFLLKETTIFLEKNLATDLGLKPGEMLSTSRGNFQILGLFANPSGEPIILMDIAHAQRLFDLSGKIDRVDLILSDEAGFLPRWKEGYRIQSHSQKKETLLAMLAAFRLNLEALSLLALFVGVFLIYNTTTFAVVSRRRDAGILRSLGAQNSEIVLSFLAEILIFGILGGALGAIIGHLLAHFLVNLVGSTISNLYFFVRPVEPPWSIMTILAGVIIGGGASLLGGFLPLLELIRIDPVQTLSGRTVSRKSRIKTQRVAFAGLAIIVVSIILLLLSFINVYVGFAGVFAFILGFSLLTGIILIALGPAMKWLFYHLGGLPGKVAAGNIRQNLSRTNIAVSAFMIALALSIGLGSMIGSFRKSLVWWMGTQLRGDLYISTIAEIQVPEEFYEELKAMPGLGGIDPYRNVQVMYNGFQISISSVDASVLQRYARFGWLKGGNENWEAVKNGGVIISESFARRFKTKEGDRVTLDGIEGPVALSVGAIFYDYTTEHGLIMMDRSTYIKIFGDRTINSLGIFIDPGNPQRAELLGEIRRKAQERNLPVLTSKQLERNILALFDSTFAVTRSMRFLAIIVAFFGITGALLTLFLERRKDFGIYRALGFSTSQIGIMTVLEGLGMGLVSFLLSTVGGTALALILIKVINLRSFNWTVFYYPEWQPYVVTGIVAICASLGAALHPLWKVCRTYPQMQIREE